MKRHNLIAAVVLLALLSVLPCRLFAQQDPLYSQYMFNIQPFNPAYAGSWQSPGITLLSRQQWMGFENNPETQTLTFQIPFSSKVGGGLSLMNDDMGRLNRKALFADYSYGIKVNSQTMLRLGISAGVSNFRNRLNDIVIIDPDDPSLLPEESNLWLPNAGVGCFIHSSRFYAGLSAPKLLLNESGTHKNSFSINNLYLIGGFVLPISPGIEMKPSASVRYTNDEPLVADINLSFLIADVFWIGGLFRTSDEIKFGLNTSVIIANTLRLGYAYDFMHYAGLNSYSGATHELMLSIEFHTREKVKFVSPRYF